MAQAVNNESHNIRVRQFEWASQTCPCGCGKIKHGWRPAGTPDNFYVGPGFMVAHDVIEHVGNGTDWKSELVAFGSTLFGRAPADHQMYEHVANDFLGFASEHDWDIPEANERWDEPLPGDGEKHLNAFMHAIVGEYLNAAMFKALTGDSPIKTTNDTKFWQVLERAEVWFRLGWRVSNRLFKTQGVEVYHLFERLRKAVDANIEQVAHKDGDKLTIRLDRANRTFSLMSGA